jgi:hypothetical protein
LLLQTAEQDFAEKENHENLLLQSEQQNIAKNKNHGGHNKERIMLSINAFKKKKFCLKANTSKSDEIHDYYVKLENIINKTIHEVRAWKNIVNIILSMP